VSLKAAVHLAKMGFYVFPIIGNTKKPVVPFKDQATRDPKKLKMFWIDPVLNIEQDYNVGIYTGKFKDNQALIVVDIDDKKNKKGSESLFDLEMQGFVIPETCTQTTPTGGKHLIYLNNFSVKQGVNVLGSGLDIRSSGGYIVSAGSSIDNIFYKMKGTEVVQCPEWIIETCGPAYAEKSAEVLDLDLDISKVSKKAITYLQEAAPESIKGEGGDHTAFQVAARLKDFGVSREDALPLMMEYWFSGSGWNPSKLAVKIENVYKYSQNPIGSATAAFDFKEDFVKEAVPKSANYLVEINKDHALIFLEGMHIILHETVDDKGRKRNVFYSETSFKRKYSPFNVQEGNRVLSYADKWLNWQYRRSYLGLTFAPEMKTPSNYFNLWSGFTCEPVAYEDANADQKRGFDLWEEHLTKNVCSNTYEMMWLLTYLAHMIQKPWEKPLTTLVFRGRKGTGKNALIERVGKLLGAKHFLVADDARYFTSNFNGHLDSCLMLVLDEAFWSGDKKAEGKLKGLTTGSEILIERKGKETYSVDNYLRMVILGNEKWLVPATEEERRYAVFTMSEGRRLDTKFFKTMRILLDEKGGKRVLLHYLKNFDLDNDINISIPPSTSGLLDQKLESMPIMHQWWHDCLVEGMLIGSEFSEDFTGLKRKQHIRDCFFRYSKKRNVRGRLPNDTHIGRSLHLFIGKLETQRKLGNDEDRREWCYHFPTVPIMRKSWEKFLGHKVEWPEEGE